jgi:hypothetical protein
MPGKKSSSSKSNFIRSQPASLSAAEVVAKAKAQGLRIRPGLVYNVRNGSKAKKAAAKPTSTAPTIPAPKTPVTVSKADFVRARSNLSPKEIVEDAKAAGIKLDVGYVHDVRGYDRMKAKKKRAAKKASTLAVTNGPLTPVPAPASDNAENLLRALGAEIGLGRAIELLEAERARVRAVIGAG